MSHILVRRNATVDELVKEIIDQEKNDIYSTVDEIKNDRAAFSTMFLNKNLASIIESNSVFSLFYAIDENDVEYEKISFAVQSRYTINGDTFIAGGGFAVNLSEMIRLFEKVITEVEAHLYSLCFV